MKRLTYRLNEKEEEDMRSKYLHYKYHSIPDYDLDRGNPGRITSDMLYNKLGKLEDIEEELGCPIEVVFKALKNGSCGSIVAFLQNDYNEVYQKGLYKPLIINGLSRKCNTNEWCFCCCDSLTLKGYTFYLKDYKKTWWLEEDRSE